MTLIFIFVRDASVVEVREQRDMDSEVQEQQDRLQEYQAQWNEFVHEVSDMNSEVRIDSEAEYVEHVEAEYVEAARPAPAMKISVEDVSVVAAVPKPKKSSAWLTAESLMHSELSNVALLIAKDSRRRRNVALKHKHI